MIVFLLLLRVVMNNNNNNSPPKSALETTSSDNSEPPPNKRYKVHPSSTTTTSSAAPGTAAAVAAAPHLPAVPSVAAINHPISNYVNSLQNNNSYVSNNNNNAALLPVIPSHLQAFLPGAVAAAAAGADAALKGVVVGAGLETGAVAKRESSASPGAASSGSGGGGGADCGGNDGENVKTLFVSGLPIDTKHRELYLLFRWVQTQAIFFLSGRGGLGYFFFFHSIQFFLSSLFSLFLLLFLSFSFPFFPLPSFIPALLPSFLPTFLPSFLPSIPSFDSNVSLSRSQIFSRLRIVPSEGSRAG